MSRSTALHDWKLNTAIAKILGNLGDAETDQIVKATNSKIMLARFADGASEQHRVDAGRLLLEIRRRKEAESIDWWPFVKANIEHRGRRDVERLMALARADDPELAAEQERERNREHQRRSRKYKSDQGATDISRKSNVVGFPQQQSKVDYIFTLIESLNGQEREQLRRLCEGEWSW